MKVTVEKIMPEPYPITTDDLPRKPGVWNKKCDFEIRPNQVAFIRDRKDFYLVMPPGRAHRTVEVTPKAEIFISTGDIEAEIHLDDVQFAGNVKGTVRLKLFLCWLDDFETTHPMLAACNREIGLPVLTRAMAKCLDQTFRDGVMELFADIDYDPAKIETRLATAFEDTFMTESISSRLRQFAGLAFFSAPLLIGASAPEVDRRIARERIDKEKIEALYQKAEKAAEIRRVKLAHALGNQAAQHALSISEKKARQEQILLEKETLLNAARFKYGIEKLKTEDDFRRQIAAEKIKREKIIQEGLKAEATRKQYEAEGRKHEAAYLRQKAELAGMEEKMLQKRSKDYEVLLEKLNVLNQKADAFASQPPPQTDQSLELLVNWRAFNWHGVIAPRLQDQAKLPEGAWVDVEVTVTRDAYVYILLKGSAGHWQCLVPDIEQMMNISRSNLQKAGETVLWPGPDPAGKRDPFWELDDHSGYERLSVIASLDRVDIEQYWRKGDLDDLVKKSKPYGMRGFRQPKKAGSSVIRADEVIFFLAGEKSVVQHFVIDHV